MRIALGIKYDGSAFHGWQRQPQKDLLTIQESVETAVSKVADHPVQVICAGRTDAGVHAIGQVIHFDSDTIRNEKAWVQGTNSYLPPDISVQWAKTVDDDFHARYSAIERCYRYIIYNHPVRPAVLRNYVAWHFRHLDETLMAKAATHFLGEHDFSSFRGSTCQSKSPVRKISEISLQRDKNFIFMQVKANGFLQHMIRNIAGTLMKVGERRQKPDWVKQVLEARDRKQAGITAPASGLYLLSVIYPEKYSLITDVEQAEKNLTLDPITF